MLFFNLFHLLQPLEYEPSLEVDIFEEGNDDDDAAIPPMQVPAETSAVTFEPSPTIDLPAETPARNSVPTVMASSFVQTPARNLPQTRTPAKNAAGSSDTRNILMRESDKTDEFRSKLLDQFPEHNRHMAKQNQQFKPFLQFLIPKANVEETVADGDEVLATEYLEEDDMI